MLFAVCIFGLAAIAYWTGYYVRGLEERRARPMRAPVFRIPLGAEYAVCEIHGDPKRQPEPESLRIVFPGGEVNLTRCSDGSYWAHITRHESELGDDIRPAGRLVDARIDVRGKHASECDAGDFANPETYHVAVRIERADRVGVP